MSPQYWPWILSTCCVLTFVIVRKRSVSWWTSQSWASWHPSESLVVAPDVRSSGGVGLTSDVWRQSLVRTNVRPFFFDFFWFFFKNEKTPFFPYENRATRRERRHRIDLPYTTDGVYSSKKHDRHIDSRVSLLEDNSRRDDHTTKTARDEGVEKHSCQIEWRGAHVNLVYYNGKQVLRAYNMLHVTTVLHVRIEDEHTDTYTYILRWYIRIYIHTSIYIYIYTYIYTHTHIHTSKYSFNILASYL
jgi:hypothetical protein